MARFLKALQGLQSQEPEASPSPGSTPGSVEKSPAVPIEPVQAKEPTAAAAPSRPVTQTLEMPEAEPQSQSPKKAEPLHAERSPEASPKPEPAAPQPSPEQTELIRKLTQQLAVVVRQRDAVAQEVKQVKQQLESHDKRHEEEIVQLRHTLESHQHSSQSIESELKTIQSELRGQLKLQEEVFAKKLDEFEKRVQAQAAPPAPVVVEVPASAPPEKPTPPQPAAPKTTTAKPEPAKPVAPKPTAAAARAENAGVFKPQLRPPTIEKPIPNIDPLRQAVSALDQPRVQDEFAQLAESMIGNQEDACQVFFLGTCVPDRSSASLVLHLAAWLSQQSCRVFIIDGALRAKTLSDQLGLRNHAGLFETVRRETYPQDGTYHDQETGVAFTPAGKSSFMLTGGEQDSTSLRDQLREILKSYDIVLISGEGPDISASWLLAQVAQRTYLQANLGQVSREDIQAAVDCYRQLGIEPAGLIAANVLK